MLNLYAVMRLVASATPSIINLCLSMWCVILAPTTMLEQRSRKRIKTDKRDAEIIAKCLAQHNYSPVQEN